MTISFCKTASAHDVPIVVPVIADGPAQTVVAGLPTDSRDAIAAAEKTIAFDKKLGQCQTVFIPEGGTLRSVTFLGLGDKKSINTRSLRLAGGKLLMHLRDLKCTQAEVMIDGLSGIDIAPVDAAIALAMGADLARYSFTRHKTKSSTPTTPDLCFCLAAAEDAQAAHVATKSLTAAVTRTRDWTNEPGNMLTPSIMAGRIQDLAMPGLTVDVLDRDALTALGMGSLLGVAQGSDEPPAVVVMSWRGADTAPIVLVGKGVTFDSGGLLPKGPEEMWDMKNDMAGAAAVVSTIRSLAERAVPVHAVGIVGLVENMPSGHALRPGDVVRSLSGQTIEVLHTDAEGRLVLADLLTYAQQKFSPRAIINIATLTGAMTAVLGQEFAGLFSNNDSLAADLVDAGKATGEKTWRLPLDEVFDRMLDSSVADIQNIPKQRLAGSATAAQFLARFIGDVPWAHLDICGTAWRKDKDNFGITVATGYGVLLLDHYVKTAATKR